MQGKETKHVVAFRDGHLKPGESIQHFLEGWIGEMMGKGDKAQHNGMFILTDTRACFYRKGLFGEVLETIPLPKITSIETRSMMGYRVLRLHTSHDELAFKSFEDKALFDTVYACIEELRHPAQEHSTAPPPADVQPCPMDQLKKLSELRNAGILTDEEFNAKKAELLARM